jgi:osmotically inducible protein OsmC
VSLDSSGIGSYDVSWPARTEEPNGVTSPEELIAAAHSTCYSMSLSNVLTKAGHTVETIDTKADVTFVPGEGITGSALTTRATVPGLSAEEFAAFAEEAKTACPCQRRARRHHDHPGRRTRLTFGATWLRWAARGAGGRQGHVDALAVEGLLDPSRAASRCTA